MTVRAPERKESKYLDPGTKQFIDCIGGLTYLNEHRKPPGLLGKLLLDYALDMADSRADLLVATDRFNNIEAARAYERLVLLSECIDKVLTPSDKERLLKELKAKENCAIQWKEKWLDFHG